LLKLSEMMDLLDAEKQARWEAIKTAFVRNNRVRGLGDTDRMAQVIGQMSMFVEGLEGIKQALNGQKKSYYKENETGLTNSI